MSQLLLLNLSIYLHILLVLFLSITLTNTQMHVHVWLEREHYFWDDMSPRQSTNLSQRKQMRLIVLYLLFTKSNAFQQNQKRWKLWKNMNAQIALVTVWIQFQEPDRPLLPGKWFMRPIWKSSLIVRWNTSKSKHPYNMYP